MRFNTKFKALLIGCFAWQAAMAQSPLVIPPALTGTNFDLEIKNGVTQFFKGIDTPTYGINGDILAPTIIVNKWDWVKLNVKNSLKGNGNSTTIHWHGLHVPPEDDGGPHQIIEQGSTWSPEFQILNDAGTFWYHPHGDKKTDLHVSAGLAGFFLIKDSAEAALDLPRTYGVDDIPLVVQTKAFDEFNRIAIATEEDSTVCVNGIVKPYFDAPAQVIRFRIVNGSSMRTYNFGLTGNKSFKLIATDAGLIDSALTLTRIMLSPGERAEILVDLQGMQNQSISILSYSSEMQNGIYGAKTVQGMMGATIPDYDKNPLNGADFEILKINVVAQTANPVTTTPTKLFKNIPWTNYTETRVLELRPEPMMGPESALVGPFNINGEMFDMEKINIRTYLNNTEKWRITNRTGIAHPFHIHDVFFYILNVNGGAVPEYKRGKKDVVLVLPGQYVEFITKFEDFADDMVPYMYHCHLLHHEDDGMMGSFLVLDTTKMSVNSEEFGNVSFFPNPASNFLNISLPNNNSDSEIRIINILGETVLTEKRNEVNAKIDISALAKGIYVLEIRNREKLFTQKLIKQ